MGEEVQEEVTAALAAWRRGEARALDRVVPLVYPQLKALAQRQLRRERPGHTLQPTALLNELYLRLVGRERPGWEGRTHFLAVAAQLMRRILVDHARARGAAKRGGEALKVALDTERAAAVEPREPASTDPVDLLALDEALERLAAFDERKARVMELRYFGGLTVQETAAVLEVSEATVYVDSRLGRAFLIEQLAAS